MMKKIKYILFFAVLILFSACEKQIDLQPESTLTYKGFWDTEEAARAAHAGLYATFREYNRTFWGMGELRSDIWGGSTLESPYNLDLINQNISTTIVPYSRWADFYILMHRINDFLYNIDNVAFQDETEKQHMIGQIYGMRAFVYYTMLKTWGEVPITTEPLLSVNPEDLAKPRSSKEEVMSLIKSDIEHSLEAFGENNSFWNGKKTYWSKAATLTLKGDVYIWSGNLMGGGSADFTEAKNALEQVQAIGFSLVPEYSGLWGPTNETNEEFIFTLDYTLDQATNFYSLFIGRATEINATWDAEGNSMADFVANGASRYGPQIEILEKMSGSIDTRGNATFIKLYGNDAGHIPFDADGYQASILKKFLGPIVAGSRVSTNDVPIYRYADVVLLLAQAKNLLGEDPSAEINLIRQRAYGANYDSSMHAYANSSPTENAKAILEERLKEFIGEGKRWWDLRRAGDNFVFDAIENLAPGDEYLLLLPITPGMIGNNPALEQTPGYN